MKTQTAAMALFVASTLLPLKLFACTYFPPNYKVGSSFTVHVASQKGLTFAGVRVVLVSGDEVAYSAHTDPQGSAQFRDVITGDYSLEIDQLGTFGGDTAYLTVSGNAAVKEIKLLWPSARVLRATVVKGIILNSGNATPLSDTYLAFVHAIDGSLRARNMTQKTGDFDLGKPEPGLYFLKVDTLRSGDWEPRGEIPVLVENGPERELTLAVAETSCGMWYSAVCTAPEKTVSHLAGTLVDASGAVVDRAQIELMRPHDKRVLASVASDKVGHFDFQYMPDDEYQLRISAVGFAPRLIPITLASSSKTKISIEVQLNVIGSSCGDADNKALGVTSAK